MKRVNDTIMILNGLRYSVVILIFSIKVRERFFSRRKFIVRVCSVIRKLQFLSR